MESAEKSYWANLEYRVTRELAEMSEPALQSLWCDGFIPINYVLEDFRPRIEGKTWICTGPQQAKWDFTLILPVSYSSFPAIDWPSLIPAEDTTRWLGVDFANRAITIEPHAATPDSKWIRSS